MTPDIVSALRRVPEKRLLVFELAAELRLPDGTLDYDAAALRREELELAQSELDLYTRGTTRALRALHDLL